MHQHIPDISLRIFKENWLEIDPAICGKLFPQISEKLYFDDYNLHSLLFVKEQQPRTGYEYVTDNDISH